MPRALIVGGTGLIGRATARRLLAAGWQVDLTGRNPAHMPAEIAAAGGRFIAAERDDSDQLLAALGGGADLLVDCICYTAADATSPVAVGAQRWIDGDDLEQGRVRRRLREPLQLGDRTAFRRPDPRDAANDGPGGRRLQLT